MSETQIDLNAPKLCWLCKDFKIPLRLLFKHLGKHQEQLALFSLPPSAWGDAKEIEENNGGPVAPHSDSSSDEPKIQDNATESLVTKAAVELEGHTQDTASTPSKE
jgi:hypothetical protein